MKYYKKDIAFEQIRTAMMLFFQDIWPIATNTLLHATKVMLEDLERKKWGSERMEVHLNPSFTEKERKKVFNKLNVFPNFCKHSEYDNQDYLDSEIQLAEFNELQIYLCTRLYTSVFWQDTSSNTLFALYVNYLMITEKFDYLFIVNELLHPEEFKELKKSHQSLNLVKDNPNLKKEFYSLLMEYSLN